MMHHGLSRRVFMLGLFVCAVLAVIFVIQGRGNRKHKDLLPVLQSYGFWYSDAVFSCSPFAYDETGRPNGIFIRIRPGATGTLRATHYHSAADEASVREIKVSADPKFELFLSIMQSTRPMPRPVRSNATLRPSSPIDSDATSGSLGWFLSAAWSTRYNVTWRTHEIMFTGESASYPLCSLNTFGGPQKPSHLVSTFYLVPHGHAIEAPFYEDILEVLDYCKRTSVDAIAIEYLPGTDG
jgi:hypothetical protein